MKFNSGDVVKVREGINTGKLMKVVEVNGPVLLLEDATGTVIELYSTQVQKQMLFG